MARGRSTSSRPSEAGTVSISPKIPPPSKREGQGEGESNPVVSHQQISAVGVKVIAIDGPVGAGKTVVGRELARQLGFKYLDTGVMYRAITWLALRCSVPIDDTATLGALAARTEIRLLGPDRDRVQVGKHQVEPELRTPEVERQVSLVARVPEVRRAMVQQQRAMAAKGNIVMVGRDIGTVVLPDADLKVFMLASPQERARRRWLELRSQGVEADLSRVLRDTQARDELDSRRADSPLVPAQDAFLLDTEGLTIPQVVARILQRVRRVDAGANPR